MYEPASVVLYKLSIRTQRIYTFTHYKNYEIAKRLATTIMKTTTKVVTDLYNNTK